MISMAGTAENDEMSSLFSGRAACHLLAKQFERNLLIILSFLSKFV